MAPILLMPNLCGVIGFIYRRVAPAGFRAVGVRRWDRLGGADGAGTAYSKQLLTCNDCEVCIFGAVLDSFTLKIIRPLDNKVGQWALVMIDVAMIFLAAQLNNYLGRRYGESTPYVVLDNLVEPDGSSPAKNKNKIVITLINLEQETAKQFYGASRREAGRFDNINPPLHFNLDLLLSANFDDYSEALRLLTDSIRFFQANILFNRINCPSLPAGINSLQVEVENSPYTKTHNLWSALGAKYIPSIIYKVRHVTVDADQVHSSAAAIEEVAAHAVPNV